MRTRYFLEAAFTRLDAIVVIIAAIFLPICAAVVFDQASKPRVTSRRINCVSNIKQLGLAYRMWANEHGDQFPFQVSTNEGGSLEYTNSSDTFRHFLVMSNELVSPKVLACSTDSDRSRATSFFRFGTNNLSYFVGLDAKVPMPATILSGDRNVIGGTKGNPRAWTRTNTVKAGFTSRLHNQQGNIGLADGSAQQVTEASFKKQIESDLKSAQQVRFLIPP